MFCKNCGAPVEDDAKFCKNCGGKIAESEEIKNEAPATEEPKAEVKAETAANTEAENPLKAKLNKLLSGPLFLTAAILLSASVLFGLFAGDINVITILFVIFAWMAYAAAAKNNIQTSHIRNISGTFCATKIVMWVIIGAVGVIALATLVLGPSISTGFMSWINSNFGKVVDLPYWAAGSTVISVIIFVALLFIVAFLVVMNLGYISIHKFFRSLYQSLDSETVSVEKAKSAYGWALALGIITAVRTLSSLGVVSNALTFISTGCLSAVFFILFVMIKQNFTENK